MAGEEKPSGKSTPSVFMTTLYAIRPVSIAFEAHTRSKGSKPPCLVGDAPQKTPMPTQRTKATRNLFFKIRNPRETDELRSILDPLIFSPPVANSRINIHTRILILTEFEWLQMAWPAASNRRSIGRRFEAEEKGGRSCHDLNCRRMTIDPVYTSGAVFSNGRGPMFAFTDISRAGIAAPLAPSARSA